MERRIDRIVVHYTATPEGRDVTAADVVTWHTDPPPKGRGWSRAGYHFFVRLSGTVEPIVPLEHVANGVRGFNAHSVHLCYAGGADGRDTRTPAQRETLYRLIRDMKTRFPQAELCGHRDLAATLCPGFDVRGDWAAHLMAERRASEPERVVSGTPMDDPEPEAARGLWAALVAFLSRITRKEA